MQIQTPFKEFIWNDYFEVYVHVKSNWILLDEMEKK